ncbi:hypothetical protein AB1Y20_012329 [Prymnesium parvum]|uniref:Uncharacterized protein n=1 Tax=Prymnesium parvum TaxID=97485 RepID=A0AB34IPE1_PRYPA
MCFEAREPISTPVEEGQPDHEQSPASPSDESPSTNGSALEENDTVRASDCPAPCAPEPSDFQLPACPLTASLRTNGYTGPVLAMFGSDGVSHSPDEQSAQSEETALAAMSQEEYNTDDASHSPSELLAQSQETHEDHDVWLERADNEIHDDGFLNSERLILDTWFK